MDEKKDIIIENESLAISFRRIAPFWIATVIFAAGAWLFLHSQGVRIINYIEYPETTPLALAETYRLEAEELHRIVTQRFADLKNDPNRYKIMQDSTELKRSEKLFMESLELKPNMKGIYPYLADLASFQGNHAEMNYYKGMQAASKNQPEAAVEFFNLSLEREKEYMPALVQKIRLLVEMEEISEAEEIISEIIDAGKADAGTWFVKAKIETEKGNEQGYRKALEKAFSIDSSHLESAMALGDFYAMKGDYDKAINVFEKTLKHYPRNANLLHRLGNSYLMSGRIEKAVDTLRDASEIEKFSAPLWFDLARAYREAGKEAYSESALQKAIKLDPAFQKRILSSEGP